jgi:hypothetical protein
MTKIVKFEMSVDTSNPDHMKALTSMLGALSGKEYLFKAEAEAEETDFVKQKLGSEAYKGSKADMLEDPKVKEQIEDKVEKVVEEKTSKASYTIEKVREKVRLKVKIDKEAVKAKLAELGAASVTKLDVAKYDEFVDFLETI